MASIEKIGPESKWKTIHIPNCIPVAQMAGCWILYMETEDSHNKYL